jgi:hypothetical protein
MMHDNKKVFPLLRGLVNVGSSHLKITNLTYLGHLQGTHIHQ